MWSDNETTRDFLNFSGVADTVAEIIVQAEGRPISIGVSGAWGVGKSSMIKLIREGLEKRPRTDGTRDFVFVDFNAWLYQGYDDARAALMEVIATTLEEEAASRKKGVDKVKDLIRRVDWLRAAKLTAGSALAMSLGLPPIGLIGEVWRTGSSLYRNGASKDAVEGLSKSGGELGDELAGMVKPKREDSPPNQIQAIRASFESALEEMNVTLVVLIDDLDRCLPETTISTLEAVRLFLFLKHAAFVVAADTEMIKHAVRKHFEGVPNDDLVTNYFDKLIQVPIRVPQLGTQEVRAYLMLLFVENSDLEEAAKETIRSMVAGQLRETWLGKKVDRAFVESINTSLPQALRGQLDTAERLAPLMTRASGILGNPRLIKRFLNALSIRMTIARAQGVGVDEAALAKMLLFERLGNPEAYKRLLVEVSNDEDGRPRFLADWEQGASADEDLDLPSPWDEQFVREWLKLPPRLADLDLRGIIYVSRDYAPIITPEDRLSPQSAELLKGLIEHPDMASDLKEPLSKVSKAEVEVMMGKLLERAQQEREWGPAGLLDALLVLSEVDPSQGARLGAFLAGRPAAQIQPSIVPKIQDVPWARGVFEAWKKSGVSAPVAKAISKVEVS